MKTGLSKREKVLLFIAVVIGVVFLAFRFLIMPMYALYSGLLDEYDALSAEKTLLEMKLQNEDNTRAGYDKAEESYNEVKRRYPPVMPNEEVDRILTGLCMKNNLTPMMLGMSDAAEFSAAGAQEQTTPEGEAAQNPAVFIVVTANMVLSGDYNSLKNLVDTVEDMDYIRISRVSFSAGKGEEGDAPAQSNISVLFEVTMLNDTNTNHS